MKKQALEKAIGHRFAEPQLLERALTHRSYCAMHNERLEFIGDSILNCAIALELYQRFPALSEGELSRLRANLVRQESLHQIALELRLGDYLRLGEGEMRSGGHARPSILADATEALIGAVHGDAGFAAAAGLVGRLYADRFGKLEPGQQAKDAKTRLQEILQGRHLPLPRYVLLDTAGVAHARSFRVACEVDSCSIRSEGSGGSRRAAEQMAAQHALEMLQ